MTDETRAKADAVEDVQRHEGYQLLAERLRSQIIQQIGTTEAMGRLEQASDEISNAELRGYVKGLRLALILPKILKHEYEQEK